jgi:replicative DNA helicase
MTEVRNFRLVPQNVEAEEALLGTLLSDPVGVFPLVEGLLKPIDFYMPLHQLMFANVVVSMGRGQLPTSQTLHERLKGDPNYDGRGGISYIWTLSNGSPPNSTAAQNARIVAETASRRRLCHMADALRDRAITGGETLEEMIAGAEHWLSEVADGGGVEFHWKDSARLADVVDEKKRGLRPVSYVKTGLTRFDDVFGGIRAGRVTVIAGRPSMGKSAVGLELARHMAGTGRGVGIFSLEMDEEEVALRLACGALYDQASDEGPVYFDIQSGRMRTADFDLLRRGEDMLRDLPISFDDRIGLNPHQMVPAAKRLIRRWEKAGIEPGMILIDHLHKVRPAVERYGNRTAEIGDAIEAFDQLAKETGVAVVPLCQLNRLVEDRSVKDKRPSMSDLKGSGNIEEVANTCIFLYRPEYYLSEPEDRNNDAAMLEYMDKKMKYSNVIEFLFRKNRGGRNMIDHAMKISLPHNALWEERA